MEYNVHFVRFPSLAEGVRALPILPRSIIGKGERIRAGGALHSALSRQHYTAKLRSCKEAEDK